MAEVEQTVPALTSGAQRLVTEATQHQTSARHERPCLHHWLLALLEGYGPMAAGLTNGLDADAVRRHLRERLRAGETGIALDRETLLGQARQRATAAGKSKVTERDLAATILAAAGYPIVDTPSTTLGIAPSTPSSQTTPVIAPTPTTPTTPATPGTPATPASDPATPSYRPAARRPTPTLDKYGRDLTRAALDGKLRPVVGREREVELVIETLCRRTKRNPVLVGPAGVGKTAIVEGLAQRIVREHVPSVLLGARVVEIQPSALVAGAHLVGELDKRVQALLAEANQERLILFIDEVHAMVGAGGSTGSDDMASLLKPSLARGDIACIAATTDDEYRRYIEPDAALERRFQPVRVQELSPEQTLVVLSSLRDDLARSRGVHVDDAILDWLVEFAQDFLRHRNFPDKGVDLLEQCVAYGLTQGRTALTLADAEAVAERMVGMPLAAETSLETLHERLRGLGVLTDDEVAALHNRLTVTRRGLDSRPTRPNAVVLLTGPSASQAEALAETLATTLFGAAERVVRIDFSSFVHPADVSRLVGAPPGYVGYSESVPLHRVAQMPWSVLCLEHLHACHPQVREVVTQALANGFVNDGRGKRIFLSDTVVLLTAALELDEAPRPLGFRPVGAAPASRAQPARQAAEVALGADLLDQVDVICAGVAPSATNRRQWLERQLLGDLADRYREQGMQVRWDASLLDWLQAQPKDGDSPRDWERLVDEHVSPLLIRYLPSTRSKEVTALTVRSHGGTLLIEPTHQEGES